MKTVAIFGGSQKKTFETIGERYGVEVVFHNGKSNKKQKECKSLIKKADIVVVLLGAIGHGTMNCVKEISKTMNKRVVYQQGFGASGAIQKCVEML